MEMLTRNMARANSQRRQLPTGAALPARRGSVAVFGWASLLLSSPSLPKPTHSHTGALYSTQCLLVTWIERDREAQLSWSASTFGRPLF